MNGLINTIQKPLNREFVDQKVNMSKIFRGCKELKGWEI